METNRSTFLEIPLCTWCVITLTHCHNDRSVTLIHVRLIRLDAEQFKLDLLVTNFPRYDQNVLYGLHVLYIHEHHCTTVQLLVCTWRDVDLVCSTCYPFASYQLQKTRELLICFVG